MLEIAFLSLALVALLILAYVFWGGVGKKRRRIGREFALLGFAAAAYVAWLIFEKLT
ncbi:hypothetical protein [Pontixanthobacter aquaemixtae]|uniref:PEP-CTERM protein-sorting domain-containing protein n=1 Tax=Pontixanthobacter aquaemixtae TaxID=1958940 RepID=A0A844ZTN6_9SPHN|nr:hypothetical protein [Pontixanthobacter aquaemixtae]MXO91671.1 hypothetical protein [Pontixanthobacter aquaemixtae]